MFPRSLAVIALLACVVSLASADEPARWYRGNLHTHSLWSDGNDFPEMICDWYKQHGYQFLALSDHNILSVGEKWVDAAKAGDKGAIGGLDRYQQRFGDRVRTRTTEGRVEVRLATLPELRKLFDAPGQFLLIQGEEITDKFGNAPIHINASNLRDLIMPQRGNSVRETIANNLIAVQHQAARIGQPILAHLNHPNYGYAVTAEDLADVVQERFFEVYNGHPSVNHVGDHQHVSVERMWDIANTIRLADMKSPPLYGLATDDSHNYFGDRGASPGRGWVQVRARKLDAAPLIDAITAGDFYASSGVELRDVRFDATARRLELEIAGQPGESYVTEFVGTPKNYDKRSEPIVDEKGKPIAATRKYSADIGQVLAKADGLRPAFVLKGDELYVRAVVTSSVAPTNPSFKEQRKQAWTQPVGWTVGK